MTSRRKTKTNDEIRQELECNWIFSISKIIGIVSITNRAVEYVMRHVFESQMNPILQRISSILNFTKSFQVTAKHIKCVLNECSSGIDISTEVINPSLLINHHLINTSENYKFAETPEMFYQIIFMMMDEILPDVYFTQEALTHLQHYIENYIKDFLNNVKIIILHNDIFRFHCRSINNIIRPSVYVQPYIHNDYFLSGIVKVLAQVHPTIGIQVSALTQVNNAISYLINVIITRAKFVSRHFMKTQKINSDVMFCAVRLCLNGELTKHALSEGTRVVVRFKESEEINSRSKNSQLQFNVKTVQDICKRFIGSIKFSNEAQIFLTSVMEYLTAEIMELSGNRCRDRGKHMITANDVCSGVFGDEELNELFTAYGIKIIDGYFFPEPEQMMMETEGGFFTTKVEYTPINRIGEEDEGLDEILLYNEEREEINNDDTYGISEEVKELELAENECEEEEFNAIYSGYEVFIDQDEGVEKDILNPNLRDDDEDEEDLGEEY